MKIQFSPIFFRFIDFLRHFFSLRRFFAPFFSLRPFFAPFFSLHRLFALFFWLAHFSLNLFNKKFFGISTFPFLKKVFSIQCNFFHFSASFTFSCATSSSPYKNMLGGGHNKQIKFFKIFLLIHYNIKKV